MPIKKNNSVSPGGRFRAPAGRGRGGQPGGFGLGPSGECWCPQCNKKVPHQRGIPCYEAKCPKCGSLMTRAR
ncbi:hypothetical protein AMJ49_04850 [Parcubacteria bacterium DG_74_2]|nr:MAG: hypothetical protein AMJ49_04850 [Parcubacteria bacterium DG_74_2]